jgi:hypothetical protein
MGVSFPDTFNHFSKEEEGKKYEKRREISSFVRGNADHLKKESNAMNEKDQPSPEQLLKLLDAQMEASRRNRGTHRDSRMSMRILSIGVIVVVAFVALWLLMVMLEEMRDSRQQAPAVPTQTR